MAEAAQDQIKANPKSSEGPRTPSKVSRVSLSATSGSPWRQGIDDSSPKAQVFGSPTTPQKQKDGLKQQARTPNLNQLPPNVAAASTPGSLGPMGPTITPLRMSANSGQRNVSGSNKAWTHPRPTDTLTPTTPASQNTSLATATATVKSSSSTPTTNSKSVSFLAIQDSQQKEQLSFGDALKDKRSLVEIQEEEKARREEETFLRWWEEEEARVKQEMEALGALNKQGGGSTGRQKRGAKGRGGGGGGNTSHAHDRERGGRGGGGRGGPKGRKEGKLPPSTNAPPSEGQTSSQSSTRYHKPSQKNPHHHPEQQPQTSDVT